MRRHMNLRRKTDLQPGRAACIAALAAMLSLGGCATLWPFAGARHVRRRFVVTAYCPCERCCGWRRDASGRPVSAATGRPKQVGVTASGSRARRGTIAADPSRYPFGTVMRVPGYGSGQVEDCGGDIRGNHIDVFFPTHTEAQRWGRRELTVDVWLPR